MLAVPELPERDEVPILLRAYAHPVRTREGAQFGPGRPLAPPSTYSLFLDTETRTDPGQALRLGAYQVRKGTKPHKAGLFYDPLVLTAADIEVVQQYAFANGLECLTRDRFIDEIFYPFGYDRRGLIVGFNLPFDLSRLAIDHASARGAMRGGFTFQLTADKRRPRLQVKHLFATDGLHEICCSPPSAQRQKRA